MKKNGLSFALCLCVSAALIFTGCSKSATSSSDGGGGTEVSSEQATDSVQTSDSEQTSPSEESQSPEQTSPPDENFSSEYKLSNPNADAVTAKVYDYICENFGKQIISCQQESTWMGSPDYEMDYIFEKTGKLPAMRGLDYMNNDFKGVNQRAIEWWNKGGLVTICWHTGVNGSGYQESLDDNPNFDKLLTEGTDEYNAMMKSWDEAATALAELRDAGVPVLWRPFHEFDGKWFWWGKGDSENFIKLWRLMYDKFTNEYGLTNLIWVLGYSGEIRNGWYVGDEYCDIIGSDTYDNSTNSKAWKKLDALNTNKPMAFHECGNVPSVDKFVSDGCIWSWFMIWHTDHIKNNNVDNLSKVYNDDMVITLDELPEFR
ncbi:MAG: glycoside hydrolase family 26 protein [Butyrivibrio sp.]|nr:glycoside hydrolase family 26 protein [Butyrivibrio sp.]